MIYLITAGDYSDYGIQAVLSRATEPTEAELVEMRAAYDGLVDRNGKLVAAIPGCASWEPGEYVWTTARSTLWASVLVQRFGFERIDYCEIRDAGTPMKEPA